MSSVAFIGLGSNLNNPVSQVELAITNLAKLPKTQLLKSSSLYFSKPQGPQDQPDFVNAVAKV
ncbi:MAG TPA: 2-amino-4-hydroxy-6-hydroxymethyldihydropteridine diphosphokinase, partial [Thiomicrospira sp.]|nr:2-amino-4-hydroxy-6-hydroxymethyldihydropteridine diphosphokinase [Thiomicrospira sp.]